MNAFTFEGIDGAGKSSLSCELLNALQERGVRTGYLATRGTSSGSGTPDDSHVRAAMDRLAGAIWRAPRPEQHHELGHGYWLGLVSAYYSCLAETMIPAAAEECDVVIVENWCHKFAARLELRGVSPVRLQHTLPLDAPFARTFLLDTAPEHAWERITEPSLLELGAQDGYEPLGRDSFIAYQARLRQKLLRQAAIRGWEVLNNNGAMESTRKQLVHRVSALLDQERVRA